MDRRGSCVGWGVIFFLNVSGLNFFFFFFFFFFVFYKWCYIHGVPYSGKVSVVFFILLSFRKVSVSWGAILSFPFMIIPGRKQISTTS